MPQTNDRSENSNIGDIQRILNSLANEDAIKIFNAAKEGISSSTQAIKDLGLTQKRYYTRLSTLLQERLVEKNETEYRLTSFGNLLHKILLISLDNALINREKLELMDRLKNTSALSSREFERISDIVIEKTDSYMNELIDSTRAIRTCLDFDEFVLSAVDLMKDAEKEVYVATRFFSIASVDAFMRCIDRGVDVVILDGDKKNLSTKLQMVRMLVANPKTVKSLYQALDAPNMKIRFVELPYSFFLIDGKYVGIEVVNWEKEEFLSGIVFRDEETYERLKKRFHALFKEATENPVMGFASKFKNILSG